MIHPNQKPEPPRAKLQRRPDGALYVVTGATRTGKTSWVVDRVQRARRLLVWDSVGEWADLHHCERIETVFALSQAVKPGASARRLAYHAPCTPQNFAAFCRLAWVYVRAHHPAVLVVEEMADVTSPGKAPVYWGEIVRKGLRYGPDIYALSQRPAESDKTAMGNASVLHAHACARDKDAAYIASELRVEQARVDALLRLEWIELDRRTRILTTGALRKKTRA